MLGFGQLLLRRSAKTRHTGMSRHQPECTAVYTVHALLQLGHAEGQYHFQGNS